MVNCSSDFDNFGASYDTQRAEVINNNLNAEEVFIRWNHDKTKQRHTDRSHPDHRLHSQNLSVIARSNRNPSDNLDNYDTSRAHMTRPSHIRPHPRPPRQSSLARTSHSVRPD